ncbi:hypothetical protein DL764_002472 [Monosporascus ibericus]|uniref:RING-type domain-containing protein n=1 Tax=Monosporascus ibericus TaxID=155417 RepID=A0A4Q4TK80_9PEZI|nr:hypothetical protein DL764_002472 [Monosporascus ibericus]
MSTKIITKNGSILGRVAYKTTMNDDPGSSSSGGMGSARESSADPRLSPQATPDALPEYTSREERIPVSQPIRPRVDQSEAIAEYRAHTVLSTRSSRAALPPTPSPTPPSMQYREPRETRELPTRPRDRQESHQTREARESNRGTPGSTQRRYLTRRRSSRESLNASSPNPPRRNPADFSDSDSSRSSSWSSRPTGSPPKTSLLGSMARDFLESSRRARLRDGGGKLSTAGGESFFPTPKITFLIDEPEGLKCQICLTTPLEMAESSQRPNDRTPVILPCGHAGCGDCMHTWLTAHHSCPFCRRDMHHKGCGHAVEPRVIAHDTIHSLPRTTAEGGSVGHKCPDCKMDELQAAALKNWKDLARDLRAARARAREHGTDEAVKAMKKAEMAFEMAPSRAVLDKVTRVDTSWSTVTAKVATAMPNTVTASMSTAMSNTVAASGIPVRPCAVDVASDDAEREEQEQDDAGDYATANHPTSGAHRVLSSAEIRFEIATTEFCTGYEASDGVVDGSPH